MNKNTKAISPKKCFRKKCKNSSISLIKSHPKELSKLECIDSINFTNNIIMEEHGKELYKTNDFYKSLANLMTNTDFKNILDNFWNNDLEIKSFIMYIQLYQYINTKFPDISEYKKIHMIKMLIDNKNTREIICRDFSNKFILDNVEKKNKLLY